MCRLLSYSSVLSSHQPQTWPGYTQFVARGSSLNGDGRRRRTRSFLGFPPLRMRHYLQRYGLPGSHRMSHASLDQRLLMRWLETSRLRGKCLLYTLSGRRGPSSRGRRREALPQRLTQYSCGSPKPRCFGPLRANR
jgi:hypothetical protein